MLSRQFRTHYRLAIRFTHGVAPAMSFLSRIGVIYGRFWHNMKFLPCLFGGVFRITEFELEFSHCCSTGEQLPLLLSACSSSFSSDENLISNFIIGRSASGFGLNPCGANVYFLIKYHILFSATNRISHRYNYQI